LIILSLLTHEINFTVIREKVFLGTIKPILGLEDN